jgi:hypothetical protein
MKMPLPLKIILTAVAVAAPLWLSTNSRLYTFNALNVLISIGLLSVTILHLRLKPAWLDALSIGAAAGILSFVDFSILHYTFYVLGVFVFLGLASLATLGIRATWQDGAEGARMRLAFCFAFFSMCASVAALPLHALTGRLNPKVLDLYLYSFDASMRVQLSFLMGQAYATWHRFGDAGMFIYIGLPVVMAVVAAGLLLQSRQKAIPAMAAFVLTGPIGIIFYNLCPALGPKYVFGPRFPWNPLTIDQASRLRLEPILAEGFRNAIPSLHMAWVLLAWWYSRGLSIWERAIAMIFVVFTVFSTLGSGEHYFVDLVVGFPFALFLYALSRSYPRWTGDQKTAVALGLALTLGWIVALRVAVRFFWISPLLPWLFCAATLALVLIRQRRLDRASDESVSGEAVPEAEGVPVA